MMYVLLIIIFSAIIHHHAIPCNAMPIPESVSAIGGEQNAFMLGTITFFILGIALIGCACCRRQKKGFELNYKTDQKEFQNELSTQENNKTEYPIFRALSPESQRNHLNGNSNVMAVNNSNENLITDDYDNNNGPISIADLENIENNNANDYIQSQNAIEIPIESPEQCRTSEDLVEFHNSSSNLIQNISSVSSAISEGEDEAYSISNSSSCHNFIEDPYESDKNINDHQTENENNVPIKQEYIKNNEWKMITIDEKLSQPPHINNTKETETNNQIENAKEEDKIFKFLLKNDEQQIGNVISITTTTATAAKTNNTDNDDGEMNKSNEDNSIEEALRALDNVIDSEDINMDEEDIEENEEIFYKKDDENSFNFQYVIQQLFINNISGGGGGGSSNGGGVDVDKDQKIFKTNSNTKWIEDEVIDNNSTRIIKNVIKLNDENNQKISDNKNTKDTIRNTAELLIDSIMKESSQIVEMLKNTVEYKECFEKSFAISKTYINPNNTNNTNNNIDNNISLNNLENNSLNLSSNTYHYPTIMMNDESYNNTSHESLENLFTDNSNIGTSTPCVRNKFITRNDKFYTNNNSNYNNCKLSLEDSGEDTNSLLENNSINVNNINGGVVSNLKIIISPIENENVNETFDILNNDRTFDVNVKNDDEESNKKQQEFCDFNFIHPGDPCTSKQALERDYSNNNSNNPIDHEDNNFKDLTTLTPMNTPIELNYSCETWNQMLQNTSNSTNTTTTTTNNQEIENIVSHDDMNMYHHHQKEDDYQNDETFDVADDDDDDENEKNLESTFEALKKQLAEILPQPQGITALPEYSDDEEANTESNRVFDEYRSPFDGIIGLLETEDSAPIAPQSEIFINYKRSLSPIMEESEDETCKTFVMMNETRCLDSTSSECVGTGEAIMGVTKVLMASNDTLFNFEDTLGEKEDGFSPRISSQNDLRSPLKSEISLKSEADDSAITPTTITESSGTEKAIQKHTMNLNLERPDDMMGTVVGRRSPPKTICFVDESELKQDNDLCSPDQQKTFSDGTSSTTDRISSDISPTVDHDTTFTTNTIDEKTCITVLVKDDERISEISEPDWDSTTSCGECVFNSLADIPNLDFNIQNSDGDSDNDRQTTTIVDHSEKLLNSEYYDIDKEINCHDDSGHSTQLSSTDDKSTTTNNISIQDMIVVNSSVNINLNSDEMKYCKSNSNNEQQQLEEYDDQYEICLINDVKNPSSYSSSNQKISQTINLTKQFISKENNIDHENIDGDGDNIDDVNFDIEEFITIPTTKTTTLHQKVQIKNCNIVINDKEYLNVNDDDDNNDHGDNNGFLNEIQNYKENDKNEKFNGIHSTNFVGICKNKENERITAATTNHNLSGEEDPWMKIDTDTLKECCDIKNDWDSDVEDDSHSSEEFMYIRGSPSKKEDVLKVINATDFRKNSVNDDENEISESCEDDNEMILNNDILDSDNSNVLKPKNMKDLFEEEGSDFESEFIPSCWDSMAIPARSALKSPDKTNNKNKKRRNVAFKKQRYDSVYEYPRENVSLPPFYSESSLLSKNYGNETCFKPSYKEEFSGGFTVSSSMRPFYDCHFSNLSYTWPTDLNFSWSQSIEDMDNKKLTTFSDTIIKTDKNDLNNITKNKTTMDNKRPDSGVGESAEMLSDRIGPPLGELCHTKPNLHLALRQLPDNTNNHDDIDDDINLIDIPKSLSINDNNYTTSNNINNSNSNSSTNSSSSTNNFKESQLFTTESIVLPTPSCTGSMDSLSSSSDSERQSNNFLITNKLLLNKHQQNEKLQLQQQQQQQQQQQKHKKSKDNNDIDEDQDDNDDNDLDHNHHHNNICYDSINTIILNNELLSSTTNINNLKVEKIRQNDSTDEDSGIESIMKVNK